MYKYRNGLIYTGLFIVLGSAWIAVSVWRLLAWPLITAGSLLVAAVVQCGEWAIIRRLDRRRPAHRRAHARTAPSSPLARPANQPTKTRKAA